MSDQWSNPYSSKPPHAQQYAAAQSSAIPSDEKTWAILSHLGVLIGSLISAGTIGWLIPLVVYLVYKDKSPYVRSAAAGALNFAINTLVWNLIFVALFTIASFVGTLLAFLLLPLALPLVVGIAWAVWAIAAFIVIPILAALEANKGGVYRYPFTLTLIR